MARDCLLSPTNLMDLATKKEKIIITQLRGFGAG